MIDKEILNNIKPGSEVKVYEKGGSVFHGVVLARKHGSETGATFTVRATLADVGVEKVYPLHSPTINKVEIIKTPKLQNNGFENNMMIIVSSVNVP